MSVYETLLDTVRQHGAFHPLTASEATEEYLKRLTKALSAVTKRLFDDMPEDAQVWFDNAATAMAEQMPVPLPEGFVRDNVQSMDRIDPNRGVLGTTAVTAGPPGGPGAVGAPGPAGDANPYTNPDIAAKEPATPLRRPRPTGSAIPPRAPPVPPPQPRPQTQAAPPPPPAFGDEPVSVKIQRMIIADQSVPIHSLIKRLKEQDIKVADATVKMARYNTLSILRLVREAGWQPPR